MRAIVTAGGTREPIDDVRVVTNLSKGRFGAAIARALQARGVEVTLLAGADLAGRPELLPGVKVVPFRSARDLQERLHAELEPAPDLLFMAAAVADYSPVAADGKLRSDADELVIRMRRNPKILAGLRERCGASTFLVGFKLLSGVSPESLVATARRQVVQNRLDLTLANDLRELGPDRHPCWLVTAEGDPVPLDGTKDQVAARLVDVCLRRWPTTVGPPDQPPATGLPVELRPVVDGTDVVGAAATLGGVTSFGLFPEARGKGRGGQFLSELDRQGRSLLLAARDVPYAIERGWRVRHRGFGFAVLHGPASRRDLRPAASVCLVHVASRSVLVGRRLTAPYLGYFAFPGGGADRGESPEETARRELREETGLGCWGPILVETDVAVASGDDGGQGYAIHNFAVQVLGRDAPSSTAELDARWVTLDEAATLRPMAAGTRTVLRRVAESVR